MLSSQFLYLVGFLALFVAFIPLCGLCMFGSVSKALELLRDWGRSVMWMVACAGVLALLALAIMH